MDLGKAQSSDFGSVYSFDGLANRLRRHQIEHSVGQNDGNQKNCVGEKIPPVHPAPAVTNSRIRRFSVFSSNQIGATTPLKVFPIMPPHSYPMDGQESDDSLCSSLADTSALSTSTTSVSPVSIALELFQERCKEELSPAQSS